MIYNLYITNTVLKLLTHIIIEKENQQSFLRVKVPHNVVVRYEER